VDFQEAWILESAGSDWVAKKITHHAASISNFAQIGKDWDLCNDRLQELSKGEKFDFSKTANDSLFTHFSDGRSRQSCTYRLLTGVVDIPHVFSILRSHGSTNPENSINWSPSLLFY